MNTTISQPSVSFMEWALWYRSYGLAIFPLAPKTKIPRRGSGGFKDATKDPAVIQRFWSVEPSGNIAVATGSVSEVIVIDVDGQIGWQTFTELKNQLGALPPTVTVVTPGKIKDGTHTGQGYHFYFRLPNGMSLGSKNNLAKNIDLKAEGGYVVLPPSVHPDGTGTYQFAAGLSLSDMGIAELPAPWIEHFVAATTKKASAVNPGNPIVRHENLTQQGCTVIGAAVFDDMHLKRLIAYLDACAPAIQGQSGHATLLTVANALVHGFCLEPSTASEIAWQYFNPKCVPPWTDTEKHDFDRKFFEAADKPPNKPYGWLLKGMISTAPISLAEIEYDPFTRKVVLEPSRTKRTAEIFRLLRYNSDGFPTLYHLNGIFYIWCDNAYKPVEELRVRGEVLTFLDNAVVKVVRKSDGEEEVVYEPHPAKRADVENVMDALRCVTFLASSTPVPCWLGDDPAPVNDPTMILFGKTYNTDILTGRFFSASPKCFNYNALDFDYVENQDGSLPQCPTWDNFMFQLFGEDVESKSALLQYIGLLLTPITKFQKVLFIVGPKRSGKGTIARVIQRLVGKCNYCGPTTEGLASHFGLQQLIGKTVAIVSDARFGGQNQSILTERILTITGEDTLTIDRKYHSPSTMRLPTRFLFLSNELPRLTDSAGALAGRFIVLKLTKSFYGHEDLELENKLIAELPGILVHAVSALRDLLQNGRFKQPESARDDVALLEDLTSPIGHFVQERCVVGDAAAGAWTSTKALFDEWKKWCEAEGYQAIGTKPVFMRNLLAAVPELTRQRDSGFKRPWGYTGIRLISACYAQ